MFRAAGDCELEEDATRTAVSEEGGKYHSTESTSEEAYAQSRPTMARPAGDLDDQIPAEVECANHSDQTLSMQKQAVLTGLA